MTDPKALRALAHPLRLDLIEVLTARGPSTAADCARHLGSTQASCSFHLRQLAKYGFVELADSGSDRRERPWRLVELQQEWSLVDGGPAADQLDRVFVEREAERMRAWADESARQPEAWRRAAFLGGVTVPVTAEELAQIGERLMAVLAPYVARLSSPASQPVDSRFVRLLLSAVPLAHLDDPAAPAAPPAPPEGAPT